MAHQPGTWQEPGAAAALSAAAPVRTAAWAEALLLPLYAGAVFVSALLLFSVQPMVGKMLLPLLGGTPAVWNTCMVFFQAALLAGYGYTHVVTTRVGVRGQGGLHLAVLLLPLLVLPIAVSPGTAPPADGSPSWWLLGQLVVAVGLPFTVVSTSAPLVQKWFASTGHAAAGDPYFLYAASNAGSLLALLAYPFVVEPALTVRQQSRAWMCGYALLVLLMTLCAQRVGRAAALSSAQSAKTGGDTAGAVADGATAAPSLRLRLAWLFLAFVPSSLMLGVTTHVTTNLATVPLLWVIPLALYLLTFVLAFARRAVVPARTWTGMLPFVVLPLAAFMFQELGRIAWLVIPLHLLVFFVAAMVCHTRLAGSRPAPAHLTGFYLWMSMGGVLGGLFNALIAPVVFTSIVEYPLALVLACLAMAPWRRRGGEPARRFRSGSEADAIVGDVLVAGLLGVAAAGVPGAFPGGGRWGGGVGRAVAFGVPALVCFGLKSRPVRFALALAVVLAAGAQVTSRQHGTLVHSERDFFGVKRITVDAQSGLRTLVHGGVIHGCQSLDPARSAEPLTYYHRTGPLGDVFRAFTDTPVTQRVAVIGLGTGSIAAYATPGAQFTFYEIDPAVVRLARDPQCFTFLQQCRGAWEVVLGDGRLALADAPQQGYGMIILDAFSADAIPAHLLTREALRLYLAKLQPGGLLVFHVSNRYLDLKPVLAGLAEEAGLVCRYRTDAHLHADEKAEGKTASEWVVLARDAAGLRGLAEEGRWRPTSVPPHLPVWTDQYSNLLSLLRWH